MSKAWSPETWKSNEISSEEVFADHEGPGDLYM
jgi:hypothetical protein